MYGITFLQVVTVISTVWILVRGYFACRNGQVQWKRECLLLTVYICLVVVARIVYFPWHHVDGHIGVLRFDAGKLIPFWINLKPFTFLRERYDGWQMNIFGNIAMFIPVGICWPLCFKKLDTIAKTVLAGFGYSFLIELSQLLFFERGSDVDDLILNTAGTLIGALIWFAAAALIKNLKRPQGRKPGRDAYREKLQGK